MGINLLPQEFKPKGYVVKLAKALNKLAIVSVAVLLATVVILLGSFIFLSQRTKSSVSNQENLRGQIQVLQATEQRLVLLKDRLKKVEKVLDLPSGKEEVEIFQEILELMPDGTNLAEAKLLKDSAQIEVAVDNLANTSQFLASVVATQGLKRVTLINFEFKPEKGYTVGLDFVK